MEPEFALKGSASRKVAVSAEPEPEKKSGYPCWKCGGPNHRHRDCTARSTRKFCFGCGRKDVISTECPTCKEKPRKKREGDGKGEGKVSPSLAGKAPQ